jgi:hypothetical protein
MFLHINTILNAILYAIEYNKELLLAYRPKKAD